MIISGATGIVAFAVSHLQLHIPKAAILALALVVSGVTWFALALVLHPKSISGLTTKISALTQSLVLQVFRK